MRKKIYWLAAGLLIAAFVFSSGISCAPVQTRPPSEAIAPVKVIDVSVERLNTIAEDKYRKTDVLVFRTAFTFSNSNPDLAKASDFNFEVRVDDGTADKTIVQSGSMPITFIPRGEEINWSWGAPLIYGGMMGSYILRGMGEGGNKGAVAALNEVWKALGEDKKVFYITGRFATSLPARPDLGKKFHGFSLEFKVPAL